MKKRFKSTPQLEKEIYQQWVYKGQTLVDLAKTHNTQVSCISHILNKKLYELKSKLITQ